MAFASGWSRNDFKLEISAYDLKTSSGDKSIASSKWQDYANHRVLGGTSFGDALAQVPVVFSMVTPDQAHSAARSAAKVMARGSFFMDCNSCAPNTKCASSAVLEDAGIRYVDTAVMSPVYPRLHETPLLISGPHVHDAAPVIAALGLDARVVPGDVGRASEIKMIRSVVIKGIEALVLESLLAARKAGVDKELIASLDESFPGWNWAQRASYNLERSMTHGMRRTAEMNEVAKTVADLGLMNTMSQAIATWQQTIGELNLSSEDGDYASRADAILTALETRT